MPASYVHGYADAENTRLADQARALVDLVHADVRCPPGSAILEIGCGVGAQTRTLVERNPDSTITAVDRSAESLEQARRALSAAGSVDFVLGDVYDLPHATGSLSAGRFDHAFVCFVLEHLADPVDALRRVRAMLRPGGTVTVIEGDHGSTYFHPDSAAARAAISCQVELQARAGGDANLGRRVHPLLSAAGFTDVRVAPSQVYVDGSRPELAEAFTRRTFTAMVAGVRDAALDAGLSSAADFDAGLRDLLRTAEPDGVFCYSFFRGTGVA